MENYGDFKNLFKLATKYENFHSDVKLNFQFNRWYSLGSLPKEELVQIANLIQDYSEVTPVMINAAKNALKENRILHAAFYYRFAEFFCFDTENEKQKLYWQFIELFYRFFGKNIRVHSIPYESGFLKAITFNENQDYAIKKDQKRKIEEPILIHGGGDSFIEEFIALGIQMVLDGYQLIMFEGPGQGEPLHKYNLKFIPEWEKPTKAILDYFNIKAATLIGVSLGGYLALRAAAFEHRITKVILWDVVYDMFECIFGRNGKIRYWLLRTLTALGAERILNNLFKRQIQNTPEMKWIMEHSYYVNGVETPFQYLKSMMRYTTAKISSKVTQKVYVMAGEADFIIPMKMYYKQLKSLKNASQVSGRIFKVSEEAGAHGQVGNLPLAFNEVFNWIENNP